MIETSLAVAVIALLLERAIGWPSPLYRLVGHPVEWIGALIGRLDRALNRSAHPPAVRRALGVVTVLAVLVLVAAITIPLTLYLRALPGGVVIEALVTVPLLAQKDLRRHVEAVAEGLGASLEAGRDAVRHIIGRDPAELDESGVAKGAIESLAENTSDGVVAPLMWLIIFGLPGAALYKVINTADSMIGYKSDRHLQFGWAAARLDDVVNLAPARLTAVLFTVAAVFGRHMSPRAAWAAANRDAGNHVSPNAGWPEAAMAGALDIRLGGPRSYGGRLVELAWMGTGRDELNVKDISRALTLYRRALLILSIAVLGALMASWIAWAANFSV